MTRSLWQKLKESALAVLPITSIVIVLAVLVEPIDLTMYSKFLVSIIFLIVGMSLFTLGADMSMLNMGGSIGEGLSKTKKLSVMLICGFVIGFIITFAEPDLAVLAEQIVSVNKWVFIAAVSLGVGITLLLAILKMVFQFKLSILLIICYSLIFILAIFVPNNFVAICFDSGSVTTGPISVPFLLSFGLGLSALRASKSNQDDSFGMIGLSSAGPILAVMILSIFIDTSGLVSNSIAVNNTGIAEDLFGTLFQYFGEVGLILLPIISIFIIFQIFMIKLPKKRLVKIGMGLIYTFLGISLFLTGVKVGFLPMANFMGSAIMEKDPWILYPLSFLLGYFIISAEPAVHVLKKQVEQITGGKLKQRTIVIAISIGVSVSVFLATFRMLHNIDILWFLVPIYVLSLGLALVNSSLFTAIAFDAGGTATGAMAVSFILPFLSGVAGGGSAFGTVAIIAGMPILTLQLLGLGYSIAMKKSHKVNRYTDKTVQIIEFDY